MSGTSKNKDIWFSSQDRTDALKVPSCECVVTKTRFRSYEERTRFQRAKVTGDCCVNQCLESVVVTGGSGYDLSSTFIINGGEPYDVPLLLKVTLVDASGGILNAVPVNPFVRYKVVPTAPYTTTVITGPSGANGAAVIELLWMNCYPCKPY